MTLPPRPNKPGPSRPGPQGQPAGTPRANVLRGMLLCARGRPEGIKQFADSSPAFISSLLPLLLFPLLRAVLVPASADGLPRGTILLATVTAVLATAVLSHLMARFFGREARWKRYATAVNWNTWVLQFGVMAALAAATGLAYAGVRPTLAVIASFAALAAYALWLQWFLARIGLALSRGRAALLVLAVNAGVATLVVVPELAVQALGLQTAGSPPAAAPPAALSPSGLRMTEYRLCPPPRPERAGYQPAAGPKHRAA